MASTASGDHKNFLDELLARLEAIESVVTDRKVMDDELYSKLTEPVQGLADWIKDKSVDPVLLAGSAAPRQ
jgi:hypothetical protein